MVNKRFSQQQPERGFALIISITVASIMLALGLSILNVTIKQIDLSVTGRESEVAFQAANAGLECIQFHYQDRSDDFREDSSSPSVLDIDCFNAESANETANHRSQTGGYINTFTYDFTWDAGDSKRCTQLELHVIVAETADVENDFSMISSTIGTDGIVTCLEKDICAVAISQGYNRACSTLAGAIQRELTGQF